MTQNLFVASVFGLLLTNCGMGSAAPDVAAYQQSVTALEAVVDTHQSNPITTAEDCAAEHARYDAQARPQLDQMLGMSGAMDDCRRAMGQAGPFDMHSMCGSMQGELDRHAAAACAGDVVANRAETAHHCQLMRDWLAREKPQVDSMMGMGGGMMGGRCSRQ